MLALFHLFFFSLFFLSDIMVFYCISFSLNYLFTWCFFTCRAEKLFIVPCKALFNCLELCIIIIIIIII